ncbi:MAG: type 1 glutamine amidotransferase [Lautropia sp.]
MATGPHQRAPLKLGILEAGAPPPRLAVAFDRYAGMVATLLGPDVAPRAYDVRQGEWPATPLECGAWLVTGSSAGVYDPLPWIPTLEAFMREAAGRRPMVGICFGHQLMAQAFGGAAAKSPKGWGIGLHRYRIDDAPGWIDDAADVRLPVSHQDQVTAVPDDARVVGGSAFTPYGIVAYPSRRAMSIQAHPEFEPRYARALIEHRRGDRFDAATADAAIASLYGEDDRPRVGGWLRRFLREA